jgi:peptide-methionine (S)-S-oxide reductase
MYPDFSRIFACGIVPPKRIQLSVRAEKKLLGVMMTFMKALIFALLLAAIGCTIAGSSATSTNSADVAGLAPTPSKAITEPKNLQTAVFAGGCFWGVEAVFEHVKGVTDARSGYAGGQKSTAEYDRVSDGGTGHAESVKVTFDPSKVTYVQLLTVFFSVAHDPTEVNRQGPDVGTQYRSAIFYQNDEQKKLASDYIDAINKSKAFGKPVATEVGPLKDFFEAEAYHQDYLKNHPSEPYIVYNDLPKIEALKKKFPDLYVEK